MTQAKRAEEKKCGGSLVRASNADYKPADLLEN